MRGQCSKCSEAAAVMLTFDYPDGEVWLDDLKGRVRPYSGYPLCEGHADRFTPPLGWALSDRRAGAGRRPRELEVA